MYSKKNSASKIIVGVLNCCSWEIDYLLMNAYYGEDMEIEWNGYEDDYLIIRLVTPTGKVKAQQEFHI